MTSGPEPAAVEARGTAVQVSRRVEAPREDVFLAWTDPERFQQWFGGPGAVTLPVEMDVRVGGRYRIPMRSKLGIGWTTYVVGEFLEIDPPNRLVFTFGWEKPPPLGIGTGESRVTVEFADAEGSTEIRLLHELPDKARLRAFHRSGWKHSLDNLARLLAAGDPEGYVGG
jgi:uncharacterized protein YndB with AHSA1/START domain